MSQQVEAVYENGLLRPLEPLALEERQRVTISIEDAQGEPGRAHLDAAYVASVRKEVQSKGRIPSLEDIHRITAADKSSWADAVRAEREERL